MSNAVINWRNWIDSEYATSSVTVSALSAQSSWAVSNIQKAINGDFSNPTKVKKSAQRYGGYAVDLGTARSVRTASLHRLLASSVRGRFRVQASKTNVLGNPALYLDFLRGETDGRTYPNDLDSRITFTRSSGGTFWRDGQLFGQELVDVGSPAIALTTAETTWTVRSGGKWQAGDLVYVLPQDGTANISLTATVASYSGTTLTLESITAGSDTTTVKEAFIIVYRGPRLDFTPVTKQRRGLLFEPARTNLLTYSQKFDNAAWTKSNSSITADNITAPDGSTTADLVTISANDGEFHYGLSGLTNASKYTASIFLKPGSIKNIRFRMAITGVHVDVDLSTGTVTNNDGGDNANITKLPLGWYRIVFTYTQSGTTETFTVREHAVETSGAFYAWGAQFEAGATATSYIWTGAATRPRSADVLDDQTITDWYVQGPGSLYVEAEPLSGTAAQQGLVSLSDGTTGEELRVSFDGSGNLDFDVVDASASQASIDSGEDAAAGKVFKVAVSWAGDDFAISASGKTAVTDTGGSLPTPDRLIIGAIGDGTATFTGWIRGIEYHSRDLADARLAARTNRGATVNTDFTACSVDVPNYFTFTGTGGTYEDANGDTSGQASFVTAARAAATGSQTFPVGAGQDWKVGQRVEIYTPGPPTLYMRGDVTAYSGSILTVNVLETGDDRSSTDTAWTAVLIGPRFEYSGGTALGVSLKAIDTLRLEGDAFTARWRSDEMTIVVAGTAPASLSGTQTLLSIDDGTVFERIELVSSSGALSLVVVDGGVQQASLSLGDLTASTAFRVAARIKANDLSGSLDGAAVVTDASATLPTVTTLRLGKDQAGGDAWTGHVGRLILKPEGHADADLVLMSTSTTDLSDYTIPGTLADAYAGDVDTDWILNRRSFGTGDLPQGVDEWTRYVWSAAQSYRYWRADLIDPQAPDSDPPTTDNGLELEVGYLGLWQGYQFVRNPAYGAVRGFRSNTQEQRSLGQARFVDRRSANRTWALQFPVQDQTDAETLEDITAFLDKDRPLLFVLDGDDVTDFLRTDRLGQLTTLGALEYSTFGLFRGGLAFEEIQS